MAGGVPETLEARAYFAGQIFSPCIGEPAELSSACGANAGRGTCAWLQRDLQTESCSQRTGAEAPRPAPKWVAGRAGSGEARWELGTFANRSFPGGTPRGTRDAARADLRQCGLPLDFQRS